MERIQAIFQGDRLIQDFGMTLVEARDGYAKVSVVVADRFLNAHRIGHGVLLFAVADAAFALAVNAARDAVGVQWSLNAFRAAQPGETVIGEAEGHPRRPPVPGLRAHRDGRGRPDPRQGTVHGPPRFPRSPHCSQGQRKIDFSAPTPFCPCMDSRDFGSAGRRTGSRPVPLLPFSAGRRGAGRGSRHCGNIPCPTSGDRATAWPRRRRKAPPGGTSPDRRA